jgi:hypothetical protein
MASKTVCQSEAQQKVRILTPASIFFLALLVMLSGCATEARRKAAENEAIKRAAAQEISRICALPQAEREAELERISRESGMIVHCGKE